MRDLLPYLKGERQGKVFGITFDDGFQNVLKNAKPVLDGLGFTATNYFLPNLLGQSNVWDREKGIPPSDLMTLEEMRMWSAAGHEVGSHTLDHVHLPRVDATEALRQITESKHALESLIEAPVTAFCYPYGDHTRDHLAMAEAAGYSNATLTMRGLACASDNLYGLPRVTVSRSTNLLKFFQKCLTDYENRRRPGLK